MANSTGVKVFGREPAAWVTLIEATAMIVGVQLLNWSVEQVAVVVAVASAILAVYVAYVTKDTMLAVIVGLGKALITLAIAFGLEIPDDRAALYIALITAVVGFWNRSQTAPLLKPTFARVLPYVEAQPVGKAA